MLYPHENLAFATRARRRYMYSAAQLQNICRDAANKVRDATSLHRVSRALLRLITAHLEASSDPGNHHPFYSPICTVDRSPVARLTRNGPRPRVAQLLQVRLSARLHSPTLFETSPFKVLSASALLVPELSCHPASSGRYPLLSPHVFVTVPSRGRIET